MATILQGGGSRTNALAVRCLLLTFALFLSLTCFSGCRKPDDPFEESGSGSYESEAPETDTETVASEVGADFGFGPMLEEIRFTELLTVTEGQRAIAESYDLFLTSVRDYPDRVMHEGEPVNYFRYLTNAVEDKRHNLLLEIPGADQKWSYLLVSTEDDFAMVAQDAKKRNRYVVGFWNGEFIDQAGRLDPATQASVEEKLQTEGYDRIMNQVRNEFLGQIYILSCQENEDYVLSWYGKTLNIWADDKSMNPVDKRDYVMSEIYVCDTQTGDVRTSIKVTYDIPETYLEDLLEECFLP